MTPRSMAPLPAAAQTARRHVRLIMSALLVASLASTAAAAETLSCSTPEECCNVCGPDSYRCARGPCSSNFFTKGFFSISMPTDSVGFWDVVFAIYGMVPYLVPIAIAIEILLHKRTWTRIFAFLFIPIVAVINAVILVKSLGDCSECARPCGACVVSKGMPSGHATNAIGLCLWIILESFLGVGKQWSLRTRVVVVLGSILLFVPVPYSRVYLGDHTPLQVGIGSADGVVLGLVYFCILRFLIAKKLDRASQWFARGKCSITVVNDFTGKSASTSTSSSPSSGDAEVGLVDQDAEYAKAPVTPSV